MANLNTDIQLLIAEADAYLRIDTKTSSFNGITAKDRLKQFVKLELLELYGKATPNTFDELYNRYINTIQN